MCRIWYELDVVLHGYFLSEFLVCSYLFWADAGVVPKIERSDMTGGNRTLLIWHSLIHPTALCIDQIDSRMYWSDTERGTIEYTDLDGLARGILTSDPNRGFYGIAIFQVLSELWAHWCIYPCLFQSLEYIHCQPPKQLYLFPTYSML